MSITEEIRKELFENQDEKYRQMQVKIIPSVSAESIIGVRTPKLREMAKKYKKAANIDGFLEELPHKYFDENQLHAFILSESKDYEKCMAQTNTFLPYVDNWATCDQMSPKVFRKHRNELLEPIRRWIASDRTYTVRFGIGMLMEHFLDENYDPEYVDLVAGIRSEEYYVNMMIAWYFATALAKQYETVLPYIEGHRLDTWTHNKTIQKAVESYRIRPEQKEYLRSLKVRKGLCENRFQ